MRNLVFYRFIDKGQLDVYFASFRIADFILNLLIIGAVTSAVIPVLSELIANQKEGEARRVTNQIFSWASLAILVLISILAAIMPWLVSHLFYGFDAARQLDTVFLSRILLIQALFFSWSFIIGALLNGYRRFTSYALAPLVYNIALIVGGVLANQHGVKILVLLVVVGAFGHFLIQLVEAWRIGFIPRIDLRLSEEVKTVARLMVPRSLSQGMNQIVLLVYTSLASGLTAGSIAIFSGMNDLQTTPTVIIANSLATAVFPALATQVASEKWEEMSHLLTKVIRVSLFLLLPTLVMSLVLRAQIVRLYIGIGHTNWELTDIAIATFTWFIIGIIPSSLVVILARVFYATKDTKTPLIITSVSAACGIVLSIIGIRYFHSTVATLAVSETLIASVQCVLYLVILHRRNHLNLSTQLLSHITLVSGVGSILLAGATWLTLHAVDYAYTFTPGFGTEKVLGLLVQTFLAAGVGMLVYFGYSSIRNKEELSWLQSKVLSRGR
ncbi:MAG: lipid II flippase MurJ [bacterium]